MALRKQRGSRIWTWYARNPVTGKGITRSTGTADRRTAEKVAERFEAERQLLKKQPNRPLTFCAAMIDEVDRVARDVSDAAGNRVRYALANFLRWIGDDVPLVRIDEDTLEAYQIHRLKKAAVGTVGKEICFLLRMLRRNGIMLLRPSAKRGRSTEQREFTPDEVQRFFAACPDRLKPLYALLYATGARLAELVPSERSSHKPLLKSEVDLEARTVTLRSAKARVGKRGKVRVLAISAEMVDVLRRQMGDVLGPYVFQPLANSSRDFDVILKRAGIEKVDELGRKATAHSFRHTYATMMARHVEPFQLKELLGHRSLAMTERYTHVQAPAIEIGSLYDQTVCPIIDVVRKTGS